MVQLAWHYSDGCQNLLRIVKRFLLALRKTIDGAAQNGERVRRGWWSGVRANGVTLTGVIPIGVRQRGYHY